MSIYVIHIFHHFEMTNIACAVLTASPQRRTMLCTRHRSQSHVSLHTHPSSPFLVKINTTGKRSEENTQLES